MRADDDHQPVLRSFSDPLFRDGAFTSNDARVRAYALQKTMAAIDLGVELGAGTYVFWGGREGVETNAAKDPRTALGWYREALNFLCPATCSPSSIRSSTRRWSA